MTVKLKKTLYVGLGGTGVATLLKVKKCFVDSYGEIPPMIGFLAIDTDGAAKNKPITSNNGKRIQLDAGELLVCSVSNARNVYKTSPKTFDWVPTKNVDKLSAITGGGAGQVRSNGRFIAYYNHRQIKNNIQTVITKVHQLIPHGSKFAVDTNVDGVEFPTNINVFASLAGGTGSGMLIDVLCLIREALKGKALPFKLYPWIVLPEVFRSMNQGPSMANVLYNSYGALRTLDYISHHNPDAPAINFGYAKIEEPLFDYAYVINNMNQAGVSFDNIDDLTDVIAKSAFLPANKMGDEIQSPFDNIVAQKMGGTYDILNKKAWTASTGSAELLYDSQAVGRAYAYSIIRQLCDSMLQSSTDGTADANKFFDDQEVMVRENLGRDDIIDHLLSPYPEYQLEVDENTTEFDITSYLENNYSLAHLEMGLKEQLQKKIDNTGIYLERYISDIMKQDKGKVDAALKFIQALQNILNLCKKEMQEEREKYHTLNAIPAQWNVLLNAVPAKGIFSIGRKVNADAVEILQQKLTEVVTNHREAIRRDWALKFYASFEDILNRKRQEIEGLKNLLKSISRKSTEQLQQEQHAAQSKSKFQIALHMNDVMEVSCYEIGDEERSSFVQYLKNGVASWIGQSEKFIEEKLWDFAKNNSYVNKAVNTNIDDVLKSLPVETVKSYLHSLAILASPLWTYNTRGYCEFHNQLDRFVVVGVGNRDTSILSQDAMYNQYFDTNGNKTSFASTNQHDRVYVLVVEDLLPIYAVNNFTAYEADSNEKEARNFQMANYLDEKLKNRMTAENFSLIPQVETDNVLQLWVYGFVFGHIHFDAEKNTYWVRSRKRGKAIHSFRFDLSHQRDVAYDMFKSEGIYAEIEEVLNRQIAKSGNEPIESKIDEIKSEDSYLESYADLSPLEKANLEDPKFASVLNLINQEIELMTD